MAKKRSKTVTKKKAAKKAAKKAPAKKKAAKKASAKKASVKKAASKKKITKKKAAKKKVTKQVTKKKAVKKKVAKKATKKKATKKKATKKKVAKKVTKKTTKKAATKKKAARKPAPKVKVDPADLPLEEAMLLDWSEPKLRRVKTGLNAKDMRYFRSLLLEKRIEIIGSMKGMEQSRNASLEDIAHMPLHMADIGSDAFDQEFTLGLIESERKMLTEIHEALERMDRKIYGVCVASGRPINRERLEFKPWAKYCIEVARARERRGF